MSDWPPIFLSSESDLLDSTPAIADALNLPRSVVRKGIAQGQIRGVCSRCGEARYSDYTCRDGGATQWIRED